MADNPRRPVATPISPDLAPLATRIEAHLSRAGGATVRVASLERLAGGACQDNYVVAASFAGGPLAGDKKLVLRSDARTSLPGSVDRAMEYEVIRAAVAGGVRTPEARFLARDLVRDGAYAYFLDWAEGEAIGRRVVGSPKLAAAREKLPAECARELARIHAITPKTAPTLFTRDDAPRAGGARLTGSATQDSLAFLRGMIETLEDPRPALSLALVWLAANAPLADERERVLVHGDFRTGNLMVTESGLSAVLDWEFARWGAPAEDLAWMCVRDWRFNQLKLAAGGFAPRARLYEEYEKASGRRLDLRELHYWEVMGNARWAAASLHQGERYMSGGDPDIELVAVARRAIEMEYEALRLIERGTF
jgi:aminoglycoside phosphotransferase (APT) family kinase protein